MTRRRYQARALAVIGCVHVAVYLALSQPEWVAAFTLPLTAGLIGLGLHEHVEHSTRKNQHV